MLRLLYILTATAVSAYPLSESLERRYYGPVNQQGFVPGRIPMKFLEDHNSFRASLWIGDKPVKMTVDTGSFDFWVISDKAYGSSGCGPTKNGCYKMSKKDDKLDGTVSWDAKYKDGSGGAGVVVVKESLKAPASYWKTGLPASGPGRLEVSEFFLPNQPVELANTQPKKADSSAGVMGLGFSQRNGWNGNHVKVNYKQTPQPTPWEYNGPGKGFFTFYAPAAYPDVQHYIGIGYDDGNAHGKYNWVDLAKKKTAFWTIPAETAKIAGKPVDYDKAKSSKSVLLDNGTTLTFLPWSVVKAIFDAIKGHECTGRGSKNKDDKDYYGKHGCWYPCDAVLPEVYLGWGAGLFKYDMKNVFRYSSKRGNMCNSFIREQKPDGGVVYGSGVFRSVFLNFDGTNERVGLATYQKDNGYSVSSRPAATPSESTPTEHEDNPGAPGYTSTGTGNAEPRPDSIQSGQNPSEPNVGPKQGHDAVHSSSKQNQTPGSPAPTHLDDDPQPGQHSHSNEPSSGEGGGQEWKSGRGPHSSHHTTWSSNKSSSSSWSSTKSS